MTTHDGPGSGGRGWIRTTVGVSQRVYSASPLAARAPVRGARYIGWSPVDSSVRRKTEDIQGWLVRKHAPSQLYPTRPSGPEPWRSAAPARPAPAPGHGR